MNERIRELVKQSGGDFWQRLENDVVVKDAYITFDPPENLEKFVELIIRECAGLVEGQPHFDKMLDCATVIEQHFGVEE